MDPSFSCRLPNDLAEVPSLRERFVKMCEDAGLLPDELQAWMLVFTELVNNSIEHGCSKPDDCVDVHYVVREDRVEVAVTDPGDSGPTLIRLLQRETTEFAETGRGAGLILIRSFTNEVVVGPGADGGTRIQVIKYREGHDPAAGGNT